MTKVIKDKNINNVAADIIKDSIDKLLEKQEKVIFAIPGGRSVSGIFDLLKKKNIQWKKVHIFMVDERIVPIDDKESNFKLAKKHFIRELMSKGLLPNNNVHPFVMDKNKNNFGIKNYESELKKFSNIYDIVLLSSGEDCHIAALYPNHHSIKDEKDFFIIMNDSPKPPKIRMSMSRKLLLKSKVAILLFVGGIKKDAFEKFMDKSISVKECPAKLVNSIKASYVLTNIV